MHYQTAHIVSQIHNYMNTQVTDTSNLLRARAWNNLTTVPELREVRNNSQHCKWHKALSKSPSTTHFHHLPRREVGSYSWVCTDLHSGLYNTAVSDTVSRQQYCIVMASNRHAVLYDVCYMCSEYMWYQTDTAAAVLFKMYICRPPHDDPTTQCVLHSVNTSGHR